MLGSSASSKYCVIGAGPCGLTAIKQLAARGIPVQCFEREDDVGGNWYFGKSSSSVCASTHLISSKRMTEFTDYPMPKEFPPFPHHSQALRYLRDYTDHFGLRKHIQFECEITAANEVNGHWEIEWRDVRSGQTKQATFAGLIVANGHHWSPHRPEFEGEFAGKTIHASQYKSPDTLKGERVLVVGAGNSGCDIAVESAQFAAETFLSMRRGYHFLPKFLYGKPVDACGDWLNRWRLPLWLYRWFSAYTLRIAIGPPENYGLPKPDHALFESHPIINSQLLYFVGHGRVKI
ncbi:MAG: cation diffusion facilitator CzcD-associated flavoprotein CzcO, partial [Pirellulaceae bacterium]